MFDVRLFDNCKKSASKIGIGIGEYIDVPNSGYAYSDHLTGNCTKPKDYKICSKCSSTNHIWRNCSSSAKMCITCHGDHRAMSYQYPSVKLIQQQQPEMVESAASYAPTPVNHRSAPIPVAHVSKTSFADVVK